LILPGLCPLKVQPLDSGSGSGSDAGPGSGSGTATVKGQVWLDDNGDGKLNNNE
jgi:hypothetical protein